MSTNDFRGFYMKVMAGLFDDHGMSSDEAYALWNKHRDLMVAAYDDGMGPARASDMLATQDAREAREPGTKWSDGVRVAFNGENDPNDKWVKDYEGQSIWNFFDDLSDTLPPREAVKCVPERYKDAFKNYCAYYGIKFTESVDTVPPTNPRDIQNLARKAFNESGANGFKLDIVRMGDKIIVYTTDPAGNDNIGVAWHIHFPGSSYSKVYGDGDAFYAARYAKDMVGEWGGKAERTHISPDTADLEKYLVDEFKSMDETLEIGAENGADIRPIKESRPTEREVDQFLHNALDWATIDDGKNRIILKFIADAGSFDLIGYDGSARKTLASGELFSVVDRFRELVEMDQADAIREFEKE